MTYSVGLKPFYLGIDRDPIPLYFDHSTGDLIVDNDPGQTSNIISWIFFTWNFLDLMNIYGPLKAWIISKSSSNFVPSNPTKQMEHSNGPKTSFEPLFSRMCRSRHHNISLKSHSKHFVQTLVKILIFGQVSSQHFQVEVICKIFRPKKVTVTATNCLHLRSCLLFWQRKFEVVTIKYCISMVPLKILLSFWPEMS